MAIKKLAELSPDQGAVYIDANVFLYHFSDDPKFGPACTLFLNQIEQGVFSAFTSSLAIDEIIFVLLRSTALEQLPGGTFGQTIKKLKKQPALLKQCYRRISPSLDYLKSLSEKGALTILDFSAPIAFIGYTLGEKYALLPRDAGHLALAHANNIYNFASNDEDFKALESLTIWTP